MLSTHVVDAARRQRGRVPDASGRAGDADDPAAQRVVRLTVLRRVDDERDQPRLDELKLERERAVADRAARGRIVVRPVVDELSRDGGETMSPRPPLRGRLRRGVGRRAAVACRRRRGASTTPRRIAAHASNTRRSSRSYLIDSGTAQVPDRQCHKVRRGRRRVLGARVVDPAADVDGARCAERRCEGQRKRSVAYRAGARPDVQRRRCADSRAGGSGALRLARDDDVGEPVEGDLGVERVLAGRERAAREDRGRRVARSSRRWRRRSCSAPRTRSGGRPPRPCRP